MIIAKMPAPADPEPIDYDLLAETIISKMPVPEAVDYEKLADAVIARMPEAIGLREDFGDGGGKVPVSETLDYAVMAQSVAERLPAAETIDYDRLSDAIVAK